MGEAEERSNQVDAIMCRVEQCLNLTKAGFQLYLQSEDSESVTYDKNSNYPPLGPNNWSNSPPGASEAGEMTFKP